MAPSSNFTSEIPIATISVVGAIIVVSAVATAIADIIFFVTVVATVTVV